MKANRRRRDIGNIDNILELDLDVGDRREHLNLLPSYGRWGEEEGL